MQNVDESNFDELIERNSEDIVLLFHSPLSDPSCALLKRLNEKDIFVCNVEEVPDRVIQYDIRGVPTLIRIRDGIVRRRQTGYAGAETYSLFLESP